MIKLVKQIVAYAKNCFYTFEFFIYILIFENFTNYIRKFGISNQHPSKRIAILANGPSLMETLSNFKTGKNEFEEMDFCAVNYFANDPHFDMFRPKLYVLSDPQFLANNCFKEKVLMLYKNLNKKVTWAMNLYVQYYSLKETNWGEIITNKNITIIPFHSKVFKGSALMRNYLFKRGIASADYGTVIHHCILISINLGYNEINLYGVDHTFFDGLTVNDNNQVCRKVSHFYNTETNEVKPIYHHYTKQFFPYTMSFFLYDHMRIFQGHEILNDYAKYRNVKIINRTKDSMIDAYTRF